MFTIGYNTNGLAHHRLLDALRLLADLGYEGVAITPDVGALDPLQLERGQLFDVRTWSRDLGLSVAIETGARFVLDAQRKHYPTLLEDERSARARRIDFLKRCIDLAHALEATPVSLWSGRAPDGSVGDPGTDEHGERAPATAATNILWERLCEGLDEVLAHARERGVQIAFEPEPGMFIERPEGYGELLERLGSAGDSLGLCLDVGHLLVTGDLPVERIVRAWAPRLVHVHLDDIKDGVHEHRMFGTGDLDLAATLNVLIEVGYNGMCAVELSRDSHRGAAAASEAMEHIRARLARVG